MPSICPSTTAWLTGLKYASESSDAGLSEEFPAVPRPPGSDRVLRCGTVESARRPSTSASSKNATTPP